MSWLSSALHESHGVPVKTVADIDNGAHERSSGRMLIIFSILYPGCKQLFFEELFFLVYLFKLFNFIFSCRTPKLKLYTILILGHKSQHLTFCYFLVTVKRMPYSDLKRYIYGFSMTYLLACISRCSSCFPATK